MQKIKKTNIGLDLRKCLQSSVLFDWNGRTRCMPFWDGPGAGLLNNSLGSLDFQITHKYPSEQDENSCLFNRGHTSFWDIFCAICVNSWIVVKDKVQEIRWFTMDFFNKKKFFRKNSNVCLIHLMVVKLLTDCFLAWRSEVFLVNILWIYLAAQLKCIRSFLAWQDWYLHTRHRKHKMIGHLS